MGNDALTVPEAASGSETGKRGTGHGEGSKATQFGRGRSQYDGNSAHLNPAGARETQVPPPAEFSDLEAMRRVMSQPKSADKTYKERFFRQMAETSPRSFMQVKAELEKAEWAAGREAEGGGPDAGTRRVLEAAERVRGAIRARAGK